jgi:5-methylcytosine-specific restriction endonuclease McrA
LERLRTCSKCQKGKPETGDYFGHAQGGTLRYTCRECEKVQKKEYNRRNPEGRRQRDRRRELSGGRVTFPIETKEQLRKRQYGICPCCLKPLDNATLCQVDHVKPVSKGGSNELANLAAVHARCNQDKHGKELFDHWAWRVKVGYDDVNIGHATGVATEMMKRDVWTPQVFLEVILAALKEVSP